MDGKGRSSLHSFVCFFMLGLSAKLIYSFINSELYLFLRFLGINIYDSQGICFLLGRFNYLIGILVSIVMLFFFSASRDLCIKCSWALFILYSLLSCCLYLYPVNIANLSKLMAFWILSISFASSLLQVSSIVFLFEDISSFKDASASILIYLCGSASSGVIFSLFLRWNNVSAQVLAYDLSYATHIVVCTSCLFAFLTGLSALISTRLMWKSGNSSLNVGEFGIKELIRLIFSCNGRDLLFYASLSWAFSPTHGVLTSLFNYGLQLEHDLSLIAYQYWIFLLVCFFFFVLVYGGFMKIGPSVRSATVLEKALCAADNSDSSGFDSNSSKCENNLVCDSEKPSVLGTRLIRYVQPWVSLSSGVWNDWELYDNIDNSRMVCIMNLHALISDIKDSLSENHPKAEDSIDDCVDFGDDFPPQKFYDLLEQKHNMLWLIGCFIRDYDAVCKKISDSSKLVAARVTDCGFCSCISEMEFKCPCSNLGTSDGGSDSCCTSDEGKMRAVFSLMHGTLKLCLEDARRLLLELRTSEDLSEDSNFDDKNVATVAVGLFECYLQRFLGMLVLARLVDEWLLLCESMQKISKNCAEAVKKFNSCHKGECKCKHEEDSGKQDVKCGYTLLLKLLQCCKKLHEKQCEVLRIILGESKSVLLETMPTLSIIRSVVILSSGFSEFMESSFASEIGNCKCCCNSEECKKCICQRYSSKLDDILTLTISGMDRLSEGDGILTSVILMQSKFLYVDDPVQKSSLGWYLMEIIRIGLFSSASLYSLASALYSFALGFGMETVLKLNCCEKCCSIEINEFKSLSNEIGGFENVSQCFDWLLRRLCSKLNLTSETSCGQLISCLNILRSSLSDISTQITNKLTTYASCSNGFKPEDACCSKSPGDCTSDGECSCLCFGSSGKSCCLSFCLGERCCCLRFCSDGKCSCRGSKGGDCSASKLMRCLLLSDCCKENDCSDDLSKPSSCKSIICAFSRLNKTLGDTSCVSDAMNTVLTNLCISRLRIAPCSIGYHDNPSYCDIQSKIFGMHDCFQTISSYISEIREILYLLSVSYESFLEKLYSLRNYLNSEINCCNLIIIELGKFMSCCDEKLNALPLKEKLLIDNIYELNTRNDKYFDDFQDRIMSQTKGFNDLRGCAMKLCEENEKNMELMSTTRCSLYASPLPLLSENIGKCQNNLKGYVYTMFWNASVIYAEVCLCLIVVGGFASLLPYVRGIEGYSLYRVISITLALLSSIVVVFSFANLSVRRRVGCYLVNMAMLIGLLLATLFSWLSQWVAYKVLLNNKLKVVSRNFRLLFPSLVYKVSSRWLWWLDGFFSFVKHDFDAIYKSLSFGSKFDLYDPFKMSFSSRFRAGLKFVGNRDNILSHEDCMDKIASSVFSSNNFGYLLDYISFLAINRSGLGFLTDTDGWSNRACPVDLLWAAWRGNRKVTSNAIKIYGLMEKALLILEDSAQKEAAKKKHDEDSIKKLKSMFEFWESELGELGEKSLFRSSWCDGEHISSAKMKDLLSLFLSEYISLKERYDRNGQSASGSGSTSGSGPINGNDRDRMRELTSGWMAEKLEVCDTVFRDQSCALVVRHIANKFQNFLLGGAYYGDDLKELFDDFMSSASANEGRDPLRLDGLGTYHDMLQSETTRRELASRAYVDASRNPDRFEALFYGYSSVSGSIDSERIAAEHLRMWEKYILGECIRHQGFPISSGVVEMLLNIRSQQVL